MEEAKLSSFNTETPSTPLNKDINQTSDIKQFSFFLQSSLLFFSLFETSILGYV